MRKNQHFERNLKRQQDKLVRDLRICILYESYHSIRKVADELNISTQTVQNVLNKNYVMYTDGVPMFKCTIKVEPREI